MEKIIPAITGVITVISVIYGIYRNKYAPAAREQLDKAYIPLFKILRTHLFKKASAYSDVEFTSDMRRVHEFINENVPFVPFYLAARFEEFYKADDLKTKEKAFLIFSSKFLSGYDQQCVLCGLPGIPTAYRRIYKYYKKDFYFTFDYFLMVLKNIRAFFLALFTASIAGVFAYYFLNYIISQLAGKGAV